MDRVFSVSNAADLAVHRRNELAWMQPSYVVYLTNEGKDPALFGPLCETNNIKIIKLDYKDTIACIHAFTQTMRDTAVMRLNFIGVIADILDQTVIDLCSIMCLIQRLPYIVVLLERTYILTPIVHSICSSRNIIPVFSEETTTKDLGMLHCLQLSSMTAVPQIKVSPNIRAGPTGFGVSGATWSLMPLHNAPSDDPEISPDDDIDDAIAAISDINYYWRSVLSKDFRATYSQLDRPMAFSFYVNAKPQMGGNLYIQLCQSASSTTVLELGQQYNLIHTSGPTIENREALNFPPSHNYKMTIVVVVSTFFIFFTDTSMDPETSLLHVYDGSLKFEHENFFVGIAAPSCGYELYNTKVHILPQFSPENIPSLNDWAVNRLVPSEESNRGLDDTRTVTSSTGHSTKYNITVAVIPDHSWQFSFTMTTLIPLTLVLKYTTPVFTIQSENGAIGVYSPQNQFTLAANGPSVQVTIINLAAKLNLYIDGAFVAYVPIPPNNSLYEAFTMDLHTTVSKARNAEPEYVVHDFYYTRTTPPAGFGISETGLPQVMFYDCTAKRMKYSYIKVGSVGNYRLSNLVFDQK